MSDNRTTLSEAPFGSVPREIFDRANVETKRFSTVLILDGDFVGSGTFIKWGDQHGILTAHHVVHNPYDSRRRFNFTSNQKLALQVEEDRDHWFDIDLCACRCVDVGVPVSDEQGPDLSVIVFPSVGLGTPKAKKEFYDISVNRQAKLEKSLLNTGAFVFAGCPQSKFEVLSGPTSGDQRLISAHAGAFTLPDRRYEEAGFDFVELIVSYHSQSEALESFAGMSGGGVWRIPLFKHENEPVEKVRFKEVVL